MKPREGGRGDPPEQVTINGTGPRTDKWGPGRGHFCSILGAEGYLTVNPSQAITSLSLPRPRRVSILPSGDRLLFRTSSSQAHPFL